MAITIIDIYEEILSGDRRAFPLRTWSDDEHCQSINRLTRYLIEEVFKWSDEEIKENWNLKLIQNKKLGGACSIIFNDSPYKMLNAAYPNRFKEYELKCTPKNYWTKEKSLEVLRDWIENRDKLSKKQLLNVYCRDWIKERNLDSPLQRHWNASPYLMLNAAYPNQFNEWDLKKSPSNFWETKEKSLKIFKEIIKKQNMSTEDIKKEYNLKWIIQNGLRTPLNRFWNDSPYKMLDEAYPNRFRVWDLHDAPNNTWTDKETAIDLIKEIIDERSVSISQILNYGAEKWMIENKIQRPVALHWGSAPIKMLKDIFPDEF
ncbi:hypothetical protein CON22_18070 [Bacillus cereus]|nr:hypothetical protein CON22_18070 [Bacillus cereus]